MHRLSLPCSLSLFSLLPSLFIVSPKTLVMEIKRKKNSVIAPTTRIQAMTPSLIIHASVFIPYLFEETCKLALQECVSKMKPDLVLCSDVLDGHCRITGSVSDAERVLEIISSLGLLLNERSFGFLVYLSLVSGYVESVDFDSVSSVLLCALKEEKVGNGCVLYEDGCKEVVKEFVENGKFKDLDVLIIETQKVESQMEMVGIESSMGFGVVNACVALGWLEKAYGCILGLGY